MQQIIDFIKPLEIFKDFTQDQLKFISEHLEIKEFQVNQYVINEFDPSNSIYIFMNGKADILKWDEGKKNEYKITSMNVGDIVGEMGYIDNEPRSASIKALEKSSFLILDKQVFQSPDAKVNEIRQKLLENIIKIEVPRIRRLNQDYIKSLQDAMKHYELRMQFGKLFIYIMVILGLISVLNFLPSEGDVQEKSELYSWGYLSVILIVTLFVLKSFNFSIFEAGVTLKNWKKATLEGGIISAGLFAVYVFGGPAITRQLISLNYKILPYTDTPLITFGYFFSSYLQEFMARGVFQTVTARFLDDTKGFKAIFVMSIIFGIYHLHFGYVMAAITFFVSVLFGLIYIRHYNLIGVTLVHFSIGVVGKLLGLF